MAESTMILPTSQYAGSSGDTITLNSYKTPQNAYTFPCDGYLILDGKALTSGIVHVTLLASNNVGIAFENMSITMDNQIESLFVRKGMKCYVNDRSSNTNVEFRPLDYTN